MLSLVKTELLVCAVKDFLIPILQVHLRLFVNSVMIIAKLALIITQKTVLNVLMGIINLIKINRVFKKYVMLENTLMDQVVKTAMKFV